MKVDFTKYNRHHWFEDEDGNVYDGMRDCLPDKDRFTYHVINVGVMSEELISYTYHPKTLHENNSLYQAMLHFRWFYNLMVKRMKKKGLKTFAPIATFNTSFHGGQDVIVAMVNSGDYTLLEAIYIWCTSCERCMNVLTYKYLNGQDGYPEGSDAYNKCNTCCDYCRDKDEK